ncbi:MAG TPA: DUF4124 domain-containing protein [Moraxellaceae bacterium]|nr:DUF4124 domain-containing protein [Moraxellaceae bacterium]
MKKAPYCLALLTLALAASTAEAAKFYKWTDADGVTHYSADPPAEGAGKASEIRVKSRPATDNTPAAATPAAGAAAGGAAASTGKDKADAGKDKKKDEATKATGKEPAQYAEKCKQLRQDLQTIQEHERIKTRDANGEVKVLSDDEKNARLDATQREIRAYCE